MGPGVKRKLPLAIALLVIAAAALAWSLGSQRNGARPSAAAPAGADPVHRAADDPKPQTEIGR